MSTLGCWSRCEVDGCIGPRSALILRAMASASGGPSFSLGLADATPRNLLTSIHQRQYAQLQHNTQFASPQIHSFDSVIIAQFARTSTSHLPFRRSPSRAKYRTNTVNMSLVNLAHVCSHLQNASKARLGLTSIPVSKMHVNLVLGLQREGFLSSVTLGGVSPPKPFLLQSQPDPEELDHMARKLAKEPWQAFNVEGGAETEQALGKEHIDNVGVPTNPARRRLWLGLKYWNNEPVLKNMKLVSKPTRRIWLTSQDLGKITRTRESSYVKGLTHPGECMFLTTDRGILEARECVERQLGGMALCRVW